MEITPEMITAFRLRVAQDIIAMANEGIDIAPEVLDNAEQEVKELEK